MRELQVHAAAVQVEPLAEEVEAHHDALAVPAGPSSAPRRRPRRLAGLRQLPQHEVGRLALVLCAEHLALAAAGEHLVERLVGEESVVLDRRGDQVDAVVGDVGAPDVDELADHRHHLRDVLGGVGHVRRRLHVETVHRPEPHLLAPLRDLVPGALLASGALDDPVVDVGDVGDEAHLEAAPLGVAAEDVEDERHSAVADVRRAVDRRPADVHGQRVGLTECQLTDLARCGVEEAEHGRTAYEA
ncbi:MAG: hypothetical protein WKF58_07635 [Ilumatobacteraceae bacterium]